MKSDERLNRESQSIVVLKKDNMTNERSKIQERKCLQSFQTYETINIQSIKILKGLAENPPYVD